MIKFKKDNWYKVVIYNNDISRDYVVAELDSRKLYEITYNGGKKDLIMVTTQELRGVCAISILDKSSHIITDFVDLYKKGCVKETDFVLPKYENQIIERN